MVIKKMIIKMALNTGKITHTIHHPSFTVIIVMVMAID